jgi:hypothetical protein
VGRYSVEKALRKRDHHEVEETGLCKGEFHERMLLLSCEDGGGDRRGGCEFMDELRDKERRVNAIVCHSLSLYIETVAIDAAALIVVLLLIAMHTMTTRTTTITRAVKKKRMVHKGP